MVTARERFLATGGLHALTEFHFASFPIIGDLWNDEENRMTILGRELIGICRSDKVSRPNPQLEHVATCETKEKAQASTLWSYKKAVEAYKSKEDLQMIAVAPPPVLTKLDPSEVIPGQDFDADGTLLGDVNEVTFTKSGVITPANSFRVLDSTKVGVKTPLTLSGGTYDVRIISPTGGGSNSLPLVVTVPPA